MRVPWPRPSCRPSWMPISERLAQLGSGVFARNDRRKGSYLSRAASPGSGLPPLLDLSLGSTDLQPPAAALDAMAAHLDEPVRDWADTVTRQGAAVLGLAWDGVLRPGAPADLVLHPGRCSAEVLSRPTVGRVVLRGGQPLPAAAAALPDFRELDGLRG